MEEQITIGGVMSGKINYALVQNYVPVFRSLVFTNNGEKALENLTVKISFSSEFAKPFECRIPVLEPEKSAEISPVNISVSGDYLYSLTEREIAQVTISVFDGVDMPASKTETIELMPVNQWAGITFIPEIIAAYVTPNHPAVAGVVAKAGKFLQKWTGEPSFDGYQSRNPNVVKNQAAAIYAALQGENIAYSMPPASFERDGQRVRLPSDVLTIKNGTCLDLAVLYASCLESAGLNPLIMIIYGHAFVGVWLEDQTFADCIEDDASAITKRIAKGIDALCLVECTAFRAGQSVDFNKAQLAAEGHMEEPEKFIMAVDIARCRGNGIRPVPMKLENAAFAAMDYGKRKDGDITAAPKQIDMSLHAAAAVSAEVTRQTIWERKLLDLSLRNSLLNFRPTSANVQFIAPNLARLEDQVSDGEEFNIMPVPDDMSLIAGDSRIFQTENDVDRLTLIAESEFKNHRLRCFEKSSDLERTLKKLHRQAKVSIEENGANTLYLALGFLKWYETDRSENPRFAPLVLVPVDLVKKLQNRCYALRIRDEETVMNITLLEMLRQDFGMEIGGLNPLPADESGVDLPLVFNTMRQGIMGQKRWDILECAFIGQFSFSRFIMWNDIRSRSDELKKNKVVASLCDGKLDWEPNSLELTASQLDNLIAPSEMAVPTSADSSQLAAIYQASKGESFVLHGPPGTGKSQTITNMIANALYNGKSVLFVAEKMAALSVVQKRLADIGLDPFCLELHSNKAQKKAVLGQLEKTFEVGHVKAPEEYSAQAKKLHEMRSDLNNVMNELHKQRECGLSLYDAVVVYESMLEQKGKITLDPAFVMACTAQQYSQLKEAVNRIRVCGRELGGLENSRLKYCQNDDYSVEIRDGFSKEVQSALQQLSGAQSAFEQLCAISGAGLEQRRSAVKMLGAICGVLAGSKEYAGILVSDSDNDFQQHRQWCENAVSQGRNLVSLKSEISAGFEDRIYDFDCNNGVLEWRRAGQKWFLPKMLGQNKLVKELKLYAKTPDLVTKESFEGICEKLCTIKNLRGELSASQCGNIFAGMWNGENSDFERLSAALECSVTMRTQLCSAKNISENAYAALCSFAQKYSTDKTSSTNLTAASETLAKFSECESILENQYKTDFTCLDSSSAYFADMAELLKGFTADVGMLRDRSMLMQAENKLDELGLGEVKKAYINGMVDENTVCDAFESAFTFCVINETMKAVPCLSGFQGAQLEDTVSKYVEADKYFRRLTIQELVARLSANIPDTSSAAQGSSELAVLQKAIRSGGRNMPVRKLFDSIPNLLRKICPCMLMSPISVAQYIDPSFPKFDLVVFDEASQLPTSEAVGAVARGENVVVVGDNKQLPPTSFFATNHFDEENEDKEDLESVLDDCLALSMPQKHLLWHYRSRHESLIAYSNAKYYDNKLLTFPSPDDLVSRVKWINVNGFYDKGATKQNKAEAEAIVNEIVRRLSDEQLRKESIGVVTFSVVQQELIDDMLTEKLVENPALQEIADNMYESVLIKNLENVQGDERDVILFSIGYGPDKNGNVSMNFGPLNKDGGWRRLNVAISRARKEMQVYSVIRPEQIDLSRTRSDGVAGLKGFLEFAANGQGALPVRVTDKAVKADGFVKMCAAEIEKLGYRVKCEIGCSEYRIDIGIINPDNEDTYVLGIVCDSREHLDTTTSRDRNILQPSVLAGLGWRIFTVNILDWFDNSAKVLEKIKEQAVKALEDYRNPQTVPQQECKREIPLAQSIEFEKEEILSLADRCDSYEEIYLPLCGTSAEFINPESRQAIAAQIRLVIEAQAPVSKKQIMKTVFAAWGSSRGGSRMESAFFSAANLAGVKVTNSNGSIFYWSDKQNPEEYDKCRISKSGQGKRSLDDVCPQELSNAVVLILENMMSMTTDDLVKECTKLFGFTRTGNVINTAVEKALEYAVSKGKAEIDENGRVSLRKN